MHLTPHNAPPGFDWVVRAEQWQQDAHGLTVKGATAGGRTANITFSRYAPDIWRIQMVIPGAQPEPATPIIVMSPQPVTSKVVEDERSLCVNGVGLTLRVDKDPFCIRLLDARGRDVLRENPSDIDGLGRPFVLPLGFVAGDVPLVTESFHLRQDEHLFGLGEKFTPLDKRGQRIISWTQDAFGSTSERSHKNIPFLLSTRGYGLLLNTGARITWELGTQSCQSYTVNIEGTILDAFILHGETPAAILQRYADLTAHAPVPPKWSFGLWLSGSGVRRDRSSIERMVENAEALELPFDVVHVDTWWMKWREYANFRFDPDAFPDPQSFIEGVHAKGLKLSIWEQPYISIESDLFEYGKECGYFLMRPDGEVYIIDYGLSLAPRPDGIIRTATPETSWNAPVAIIDVTNPDAVAWFKDLHRPLLRMGVDVFKTDFGEDVPRDAVFSDGQAGGTMHNLFPLLYNAAVSDVIHEEKGYRLSWSRSGTAGSQRYPVCWSGDPAADWDSLACTIRGGLSIGLSGIPFWTSDIGGYRGMPPPALYVRWAQFTLLCSHARMHGDSAREPWEFGDAAAQIVKRYVELRYRLFPYLYSAAIDASQTGMPVIRAMPLAFPDDPNTYDKDLQYMLGESLLIAPIYDESGERSVYLPRGTWIDYWTGEAIDGPTHRAVQAPLDTLPIYVKGGAIIPTIATSRRIPDAINHLVVDIYAGGDGVYRLRGEAGDTVFQTVSAPDGLRVTWQGQESRALTFRLIDYASGVPSIIGSAHDSVQLDESERRTLSVTVPASSQGYLHFSAVI